jgi:GAF domain-containing protein
MATSVEAELVRLRMENAELRAGLEARTQENALLLQMIADVISTLKLDQVLRHIVEHLVAAFGCHAAFVYLWEPERERLVLRAASDQYRHVVGRIELARGEGLVGWSALTRKPAMVRERAMEDPRFRYFPELEEERFQAMLTVPMTGAGGTVVAVISLHTVAPQEFTDEHVRVVTVMAPILGSAIETSELYESTTRKLTVLSTLSGLVQTVRSGRHLDDALHRLAETAARVTTSDLCVLIFAEPGAECLAVRAYRPGAAEAPGTSLSGTVERQPWERLAALTSPAELGLIGDPRGGPGRPGAQAYSAQMAALLVAAGEQLGVMACYRTPARQYAEDDVALLNIIANQAALAIQNSHLADLLAERDAPARLFHDLMQGPEEGEELMRRRGALLGCDLSRLHAPVILDLAGEVPRSESRDVARQVVAGLVRRRLGETYPGSLVHADSAVLALVQLPAAGDVAPPAIQDQATALCAALGALQATVEREVGLRLVGGVGRPCRTLAEYRRGFAEAREALRVGRTLGRGRDIMHFDQLGAARYLTRMSADGTVDALHDRYQECVERVAAYDARKHTTLLHTLETYLSCGGNIARAAEQLYVHRNTLVQRLDKLRELLGLDLHDSAHWLPLHIALGLWRLREP